MIVAKLSGDYAGDLSATEAWSLITENSAAQLVDVRTGAEWAFVGLPDLSAVHRRPHCVEWQLFPNMEINSSFVELAKAQLQAAGAASDTPILYLCRSGSRSRAAAIAMTRAGFTQSYNIAGGFEGELDERLHRGDRGGWKACGLPWRQS